MAVATAILPEDLLSLRALIHEACAEAEELLSDDVAARTHRQTAIDLHGAKGNVVSAVRLERML